MAVTDRLGGPVAESDTTIRMPDELDCGTTAALTAAITDALRGAGDIVFDCSALTFIDASGIGLLVGTANAASADDRRVRLRHPGWALTQLLRLTGVGHRFVVEGTPAP